MALLLGRAAYESGPAWRTALHNKISDRILFPDGQVAIPQLVVKLVRRDKSQSQQGLQ